MFRKIIQNSLLSFMENPTIARANNWPLWRKIIFRFLFIYFFFQLAPITWLNITVNYPSEYYLAFIDSLVNLLNNTLFHINNELVPFNGSGDTSYGWAQLLTFLLISFVGCIIWSIFDRNRKNYEWLDYWLRVFVRYFLILISISYGSSKLFALQMPYPSQSLMATQLGDLLPMRLSWVFMGYSPQYQIFAGLLEISAGLLLLYRPTITMGLILATGIYLNVVMFNLSYDVTVKLFAIQYLFCCLYLLAYQYKRLTAFFLQKGIATPDTSFDVFLPKKWMRIGKVSSKVLFIFFFAVVPVVLCYEEYVELSSSRSSKLFHGMYDIEIFAVNNDTISSSKDPRKWKDIIFDNEHSGSIGMEGNIFRQRYGRGYFIYDLDSSNQKMHLSKITTTEDMADVCEMNYYILDSGKIAFQGLIDSNYYYMKVVKNNHHFQLTESQFHWLSEYNR